jgi:hypothetical protein
MKDSGLKTIATLAKKVEIAYGQFVEDRDGKFGA